MGVLTLAKLTIGFFSIMFREPNGTAKATRKLAFELARQGHTIEIFAPDKPKGWEDSSKTRNMIYHEQFSTKAPYEQDVRLAFPVFRGMQEHKFPELDVVHAMTPEGIGTYGIFVAKQNFIPKAVTAHSPLFYYTKDFLGTIPSLFLNPILYIYEPYFYNRFDLISVPTRSKKDFVLKQGMKDPIVVISNGIEDFYFKPHKGNRIREKYKVGDKKLLVYASRMAPEKHPCKVLRMYKEIHDRFPHSHLIFVGQGPEYQKVKELIEELKLESHVTLTGYVPTDELLEFYAAADVTCLWSYVEAQGLVLLESMAQGTPSVGLNAMGIKDVIIHGKTGFLVNNRQEFIERVLQIFKDDNLRKELSRNCLIEAEKHRMENIAKAWVKMYELLIDIYPMIRARAERPYRNAVFQDFVEHEHCCDW